MESIEKNEYSTEADKVSQDPLELNRNTCVKNPFSGASFSLQQMDTN